MPRNIRHQHRFEPPARRSGKISKRMLIVLTLILVAAGSGAYATVDGTLPAWFATDSARSDLITAPVKRGDLRLTVVATGHLDSASNVTLSSNVKGSTKIISIVPEGTQAYEGMVLVKLDASVYQDNLDEQEIALTQAKALYEQAKDAVEIQKTVNESEIAAAQLAYDLAQLDLTKYVEGDYEVLETAAESKITLATETLAQSLDAYEFAKRQSKKGYVNQNELEQRRVKVTTAELDLKTAELELEVLQKYQKTRDEAEKRAQAQETERELERTKQKADAALNQALADLAARELTAKVEQTKYDKLVEQIAQCTIVAPQEGQVIYAVSDSRRSSQERVIEEGATVDNRQDIIKLPDLTQMQVDTRIHESKIGLVREGMPAIIKVSRKSDRYYDGEVKSVASVPNSPSWRQPDLREYTAVIKINSRRDGQSITNLKPGLTAEVEIISDVVEDVLKIPVQSIIARNGKYFVFVNGAKGPAIRQVYLGATNDIETEVREIETPDAEAKFPTGLEEGDSVVLAPRTSLPELFSALEDAEPEKAVGQNEEGGPRQRGPRTGEGSGSAKPGGNAEGQPRGERAAGENADKGGDANSIATRIAEAFKNLDKNGDGNISKDEVAGGPMAAGFDASDTNGDGNIDQSEFEVAAVKMAKQRSGGGGSQ